MQITLYVLLASFTGGCINQIVRGIEHENGFLAWSGIVREMEPSTGQRRVAMLAKLLRPDLGNEATFEQRWMKWELDVARFEKLEGKQFERQLMHALILE